MRLKVSIADYKAFDYEMTEDEKDTLPSFDKDARCSFVEQLIDNGTIQTGDFEGHLISEIYFTGETGTASGKPEMTVNFELRHDVEIDGSGLDDIYNKALYIDIDSGNLQDIGGEREVIFYDEQTLGWASYAEMKEKLLVPDKLGHLSINKDDVYNGVGDSSTIHSFFVDCDYKYDSAVFDRLCLEEQGFFEKFSKKNSGVKSWDEFCERVRGEGPEYTRPYINMTWDVDFDNKTISILCECVGEIFAEYDGFEDTVIRLSGDENERMFRYFCDALRKEGYEIPNSEIDNLINTLRNMDNNDSVTVDNYGKVQKMTIEKEYDEDIAMTSYNFVFFAKPASGYVTNNKAELGTVYDVMDSELEDIIRKARDGSLVITTNAVKSQTATLDKAQSDFYKKRNMIEKE